MTVLANAQHLSHLKKRPNGVTASFYTFAP